MKMGTIGDPDTEKGPTNGDPCEHSVCENLHLNVYQFSDLS